MPTTLISPLSRLMRLCGMFVSSWASIAVSAMMVKIVAYFHVAMLIIFWTCSRVGIIGAGKVACSFGLSNGIWLAVQNE